jgi:hypothetical protein
MLGSNEDEKDGVPCLSFCLQITLRERRLETENQKVQQRKAASVGGKVNESDSWNLMDRPFVLIRSNRILQIVGMKRILISR